MADDLGDFARSDFTYDDRTRAVYRRGTGPAVVVMAELPGITPRVASFARRVVEEGCTAVVPHLFGDPGGDPSALAYVRSIAPACVSREFRAFAGRATTPVSRWLRALARAAHEECGGPGVGAVGMCFTGGFALGMMVDQSVLAPVLSQPSLPITFSRAGRSALGLSDDDLDLVKQRAVEGIDVLALRFTCDRLSPGERFERLRAELGDSFIGVEIDSAPGNPWGIRKRAHSVLTEDLVDEPGHPTHEALQQVLAFLRDRLVAPA